jgi:hypothetical protein
LKQTTDKTVKQETDVAALVGDNDVEDNVALIDENFMLVEAEDTIGEGEQSDLKDAPSSHIVRDCEEVSPLVHNENTKANGVVGKRDEIQAGVKEALEAQVNAEVVANHQDKGISNPEEVDAPGHIDDELEVSPTIEDILARSVEAASVANAALVENLEPTEKASILLDGSVAAKAVSADTSPPVGASCKTARVMPILLTFAARSKCERRR